MNGKVKLSIITLCLSAMALYHASTAWDTSLMRLIYTAFGLGLLAVSFVTAAFKKKVWIVAAAVVVAALWGVFINRDFNKIEMARVIPEDAVVESVHVDGRLAEREPFMSSWKPPFMCSWKPEAGEPRVNNMIENSIYVSGGGSVDFESLRTAIFYSHWIPKASQNLASWFDRLDVNFIRADGKRVSVTIYANGFDGAWSLYIDDYSGNNPYHNSDEKDYQVLTTADLSGIIPDSVAQLILDEERNIAFPLEEGDTKAQKTVWTEDYSGNASLDTWLERTDEGGLLFNCTGVGEWKGDETPDSMIVTADIYAQFDGAAEPVLLDSVTKDGEDVKARFFNIRDINVLEGSPDGGEPIWVEVRLETVFTFGDEEHTVNNAIRYER